MSEHCQNCSHQASGYEQTLDEIEFENSIFNACVNGDLKQVTSLVEKRGLSIVNDQDKGGYTCLHYAARNNHIEICRFLLKSGARPNLVTKNCHSTALHRAAYMGLYEIVKLLIDYKSNTMIQDCDGKTALHKCVQQLETQSEKNKIKFIKTAQILLNYEQQLLEQMDNYQKKPEDYCPNLLEYIKKQ